MKTFRDNTGQIWTLTLNHRKAMEIKMKLGLDINHQGDFEKIKDPLTLTDRFAIIFLLVEDQIARLGITVDEFEERLQGKSILDGASLALLEETLDFFQKYGQYRMEALAKLAIKETKAMQTKMTDMHNSGFFNAMIDSVQRKIDAEMQTDVGSESSKSQQSLT